jgi:hypothetical protein
MEKVPTKGRERELTGGPETVLTIAMEEVLTLPMENLLDIHTQAPMKDRAAHAGRARGASHYRRGGSDAER